MISSGKAGILIGAALLFASPITVAIEDAAPLRPAVAVTVGRHLLFRVSPGSVAVTSDARFVLTQLLSDTEVLVTGVSRGTAAMTIRNADRSQTTYEVLVETAALEPAAAQAAQTLSLGVGHQQVYTADGVKRIAVGDPKIADVSMVDGRQVLITGVAPGRTSLIVWRGNDVRVSYVVKVQEKPLEESLDEIKQLLGPMEGIRLRMIGDHIYLDGEFLTAEDGAAIQRVCSLYSQVLVCL